MQKYSVFLTPSPADFAYTADLIRDLCARHGGFPFEPHVTLYAGEFRDPDRLKKVVSSAVSGVRPFFLPIRGIGWDEAYFRSLFIEFMDDPVPRQLHERIRAGVETESGYLLFPHLSLLYSDMPPAEKEALAERVVPDRTGIHFDAVKIVSPRNLKEGWRDTGQWQTLFLLRLGETEG